MHNPAGHKQARKPQNTQSSIQLSAKTINVKKKKNDSQQLIGSSLFFFYYNSTNAYSLITSGSRTMFNMTRTVMATRLLKIIIQLCSIS